MKKTNENSYPYSVKIELAEIPVTLKFHFFDAVHFFLPYETSSGKRPFGVLSVTDDEWKFAGKHGGEYNGPTEASLLTAVVSDFLLDYSACIIHGAAFVYREKGWIITGRPGVGKSTQVKNLQKLEPGEFQVICGDRPAIRIFGNKVMVYPSPWNGKENWCGASAAPLEGIVCLNRGEDNYVSHINGLDAAIPVFTSLVQTGIFKEGIRKAACFTDSLLSKCDIWRMESHTIPDSSRMLYEYIFQQEGTI